MTRIVFVDETLSYADPKVMESVASALEKQGFAVTAAVHSREDNQMHNSRTRLMIAALSNLFAEAPFASTPSFTRSYGNNPKSLNGSYRLNSNAARQKREAVKRRNIAKHGR